MCVQCRELVICIDCKGLTITRNNVTPCAASGGIVGLCRKPIEVIDTEIKKECEKCKEKRRKKKNKK